MIGNDVGVEGAKSMSEVLKINATLTSLILSCEEEGRKRKRKERNE